MPPRGPGTQTWTIIPPSDLAPGDVHFFDLANSQPPTPAGSPPLPKPGYLGKISPFDGVVFDSYHSERIKGSADGMQTPVPNDSSRTLDGNAVESFVKIRNPSTNANTLAAENIQIILFGDASASPQANQLQFSGAAVISDLIPGVSTSGHGR